MANNVNITTPGVVKITNTSTLVKALAPYKENFITSLPANFVLELGVKTAGQALYYLGQATEGLTVVFEQSFSVSGVNEQIHSGDEKITLTNTSDRAITIVPYRENFEYSIAAGDTLEITAGTVGQVLYYLAQATEGLTVSHLYVGE